MNSVYQVFFPPPPSSWVPGYGKHVYMGIHIATVNSEFRRVSKYIQ